MAAAAVALLGEDGRGFDLARRLEACGAWRAWLGDAAYAAFSPALASPAAWDAFLSPSSSSSRALLTLQLRARALLFDKASASLFLRPSPSPAAKLLSDVNPNYLQLHGDDIYFPLEDEREDGGQYHMQSRPAFDSGKGHDHSYERASVSGTRYNEPENLNMSQKHGHDEWSDSWYKQFAEKYRVGHHRIPLGDKDIPKRTSEGMSAYLKLCNIHKRKRKVFNSDQNLGINESILENGPSLHTKNSGDMINLSNDTFFPEMMFPSDCVPDSALPRVSRMVRHQKIEVHGVLDNLPMLVSRSPAMIERFGMMPDYYKMGNKYRGKDGSGGEGKFLSHEQALQMTQKVVARFFARVGFEGGTAGSMEVLSEVVSKHIGKLGRILKLLTDSYKKQFSSIELLKMFLQTAGYSNIGMLAEVTRGGNRLLTNQMQQHSQQPFQSQHQNSLLPVPQRQFHPQMNVVHPQNLAYQQQLQRQQQWEKIHRQQMMSPRGSVMTMDKNQPMVDVKIENMMDSTSDGSFGTVSRQQLLQLRQQQQQLAMANNNAQVGQQLKQLPSVQMSQLQMQYVSKYQFISSF